MNENVHDLMKRGRNDFLHEGFRVHVHVTSHEDDEGNKRYQAHRSDGTIIEGCDSEDEQDTIRAARMAIHEEMKKA